MRSSLMRFLSALQDRADMRAAYTKEDQMLNYDPTNAYRDRRDADLKRLDAEFEAAFDLAVADSMDRTNRSRED